MDNNTVCFWHHDNDGFAAAYVIWLTYRNSATYIPINHHTPIDFDEVKGKKVIIVDFSFDLHTTKTIEDLAESIIIIDHHKSAEKHLGHLSYFHYFPEMSGATATWSFYNMSPPPLLLRYIEDIDLWKKQLPYCDEVNYALSSFSYDFDRFHNFILQGQLGIDELIKQGKIIKRYVDKEIKRIITNNLTEIEINNTRVKAINSPIWQSEIGEQLTQFDEYSAVYYYTNKNIICSLRSKGGTDVSEIAGTFGGGGHAAAAGFAYPTSTIKLFSSDITEDTMEDHFKELDISCLSKYKTGKFKYGKLNLTTDKRMFITEEAVQEGEDLLNYFKIGLIKLKTFGTVHKV